MPRPKKSANKEGAEALSDGMADGNAKKKLSFEDYPNEGTQNEPENDDSTSEESEDEDAVLLTNKVENKIFETLLNIKNKNPAIYDPTHKVFHDSDFEDEDADGANQAKPSKALTYKGMVRETLLKEGAEGFESDEDGQKASVNMRTYQEEQDDLKKAFLTAAEEIDGETDFFKKSSATDALPESRASVRGSSSKRSDANEEGLISRYWASGQQMDPDEEFLKDYILNQRWREDRRDHLDYAKRLRLDEEDEEHLEKADDFEYRYNYRFEEEGGAMIVGHPRNIEDSIRKVDDRRKKKRQEKKEQQQEEKVRREEELKRLKSLKKSEIAKRLEEIATRAGVELPENAVDLNAPFDSVQHEKDMMHILGKEYHQKDDDNWNPADDYGEEGNDLWWLCDHCQKGIDVGKKHFDCTECENYTLCESCVPLADHEHSRMVAKVVPPSCAPPAVTEEVVAQLVDDYYKLDYEDVIGDMKVRFKYRKVEPYKCDVNTILEKSDKELNAIMPLSRLLTYDTELPKTPMKKLLKKHQKRLGKGGDDSKKDMDRRMTKYNVNRDRLQAFGLKEGKELKKSKKDKAKLSKPKKEGAEVARSND